MLKVVRRPVGMVRTSTAVSAALIWFARMLIGLVLRVD
jgi:hypothetical protein